ncbi:uncharacterized protein LOC135929173 [Gordionus sp. m RMFG-2023]|uniref:uncharacterized protein LOC135929173 n=1 Tax=Gordionus sp. m RMFG-2023 TaxID=3053472 RepID=UPI0031FD801C
MKNIKMPIKYKRGSIHKRPKKMQKKNFSQANQNMTETINLPHSNTENTQLYAVKLSSSQIISKNLLGTQVKIPESPQSKTIPATFEFSSSQNISKNILGSQIKLPNRTKYNLIELPENITIKISKT